MSGGLYFVTGKQYEEIALDSILPSMRFVSVFIVMFFSVVLSHTAKSGVSNHKNLLPVSF